ncbi:SDR family NAD(P)-dependent oxidoreductase [Candidatus Poriferisocius sp.]|uniref:SDR family NAD(P)-dependent oxidoreductase n=1 Tax=Candidatus Poriferisocius sp. TaxID=3101276 RepID=UPI003B01F87F
MGLLDGKVAVVTGAGHGVGRGHAVQLAEAGAKVVVNDLGGSTTGEGADASVAQAVVDVITERGGSAVANASDVSSFDGARAMIDQAVDEFGRLDILVNNAGILRDRMIFNMDESDWDAVISVHLKGHFAPTRHACEYWRERSKASDEVNASVIHTGSAVGFLGNVGQTNYAAAKGGIGMFSIAVAQDMARYGVRSNCVAPSGSTRLLPTAGDAVVEPDEYEEYSAQDPGNVGPLVVWLASDLATSVSGQSFLSVAGTITHFNPWTAGTAVTVPGSDRRWHPAELAHAMETLVFKTRHPGLMGGMEFGGDSPFRAAMG